MSQLDEIRAAIQSTGRKAVECRFYLSGVSRRLAWSGQTEEGESPIMVGLDFQAARHGTFGKATPSGQLQMSVCNPAAAELLDRAQLDSLRERGAVPAFRCWLVLEEAEEAE